MKENQRVRVSKLLLRESLINLLQTRTIHQMSVREICDNAQINRTTFYRYYGSQYDLLRAIEQELMEQINSCLPEEHAGAEDQFAQMFRYIEEHIELCRILYNNNVDPEFPEMLMNLPRIKIIIAEAIGEHYVGDEVNYIYGFITTGGQSMVKSWINKENRETPEEFARFITRVIQQMWPSPKGRQ